MSSVTRYLALLPPFEVGLQNSVTRLPTTGAPVTLVSCPLMLAPSSNVASTPCVTVFAVTATQFAPLSVALSG